MGELYVLSKEETKALDEGKTVTFEKYDKTFVKLMQENKEWKTAKYKKSIIE